MERMTLQEWNALDANQQKAREAEMPWEVFAEKSKAEQDRLTNLNIEKDRKLKAALTQVDEMDKRIKALEASGAPASQIQGLENAKAQYMAEFEKDPLGANARLASSMAQFVVAESKKLDTIKKSALRKIRKEYPKEYEKYGDALEDKLDLVTVGPLTVDDVMVMFNSLRGSSIDEQIKEAEKRGAQKALEDAGIVAIDKGGSSDNDPSKGASSLTKEQQEEMTHMGLTEPEYKDILRSRQNDDKLKGKTPRTLINIKPGS